MQSNLAIALFTKLKLLYEKENKFLAFPPATISWKSKDFSFLDMDTSTGAAATEMFTLAANFAKGTNFIAETSTILNYEAGDLWDIYKSVLDRKILPNGSDNPADEARKKELRDYLNLPVIQREDGSLISRQNNYDIYQSTYFEFLTAYNNKNIEAQYSTDEQLKALWKANEPIEKSKVDKALQDWQLKGLRSDVDNRMTELNYLSTKGPWKTWDEYKDQMSKSLTTKAELGGAVEFDFYATSFYPKDFYLPETTWNTFTLNKSEIEALSASAPTELKGLQSSVQIKSLSAEIAYVDLRRPWCHLEIFNERNWKLPAGELPLSDGGNPASGRIPAIPVAMIFARKVKVELESATGSTQPQTGIKTLINASVISNLSTLPTLKATSTPFINTSIVNVRPQMAEVKILTMQPQVAMGTSVLKSGISPGSSVSAAPAFSAKTADLRRLNLNIAEAKPVPQTLLMNKSIIAERQKIFNQGTVSKTVRTTTVNTPPIIAGQAANGGVKTTTTSTVPPPPPPTSDLELVAFVCQKLPPSPNPDPVLVFS